MPLHRFFFLLWLVAPPLLLAFILLALWLAPQSLADWVASLSPGCSFRRLTGISCPGCGGTRAVQALLHGDWWGAFRHNMLLLPSVLLLAVEYGRSLLKFFRPKPQSHHLSPLYSRVLQVYALSVCLWFLLRNIFGW